MKIVRFITALVLLISAEIATANCNGQPSGLATCGSAPCPKTNAFFYGQQEGCRPKP